MLTPQYCRILACLFSKLLPYLNGRDVSILGVYGCPNGFFIGVWWLHFSVKEVVVVSVSASLFVEVSDILRLEDLDPI